VVDVMKISIVTWTAILAIAWPGALFAGDRPVRQMQGATSALTPYGVVTMGHRWRTKLLWVCWRAGGAQERQWVQDAVRQSWMSRTGVVFKGWGDCPRRWDTMPNNASVFAYKTDQDFITAIDGYQIKINVTPGQPVSLIGSEALRCSDKALSVADRDKCVTMSLNFLRSTDAWPSPDDKANCLNPATPDAKKLCIQAVAVHEFGHAMGFQHEQLHPEAAKADPQCAARMAGQDPAKWERDNAPSDEVASGVGYNKDLLPVTAYDAASVMNYCNLLWWKGRLSHDDICTGRWLFKPRSDSVSVMNCTYLTPPDGA